MKDKLKLNKLHKDVQQHIDQLERVRRDFVANVSHELRTPLTVVRGYLEVLRNKNDVDETSQKKIFEQMYQHSLRMENIIDDLLLLSRLESEDQPLEETLNIPVSGREKRTMSLIAASSSIINNLIGMSCLSDSLNIF